MHRLNKKRIKKMKKKYLNLDVEINELFPDVITDSFEGSDDDFGVGEGGGVDTPILPTNVSKLYNL